MAKKVVFVDDSKTVLLTAKVAMKPLIDSGEIEFIGYENPLEVIADVESGKLVYDLLITDIRRILDKPTEGEMREEVVLEAKEYLLRKQAIKK